MDTEQHSSSTRNQSPGAASSKQQETTGSSDNTQQKSEETKGALTKEDQTSSNTNKAGLAGNSQQGSTGSLVALSPQSTPAVSQYVTVNQQGRQRGGVAAPQRTAGYVASASPQSLACKWIFQRLKMPNH